MLCFRVSFLIFLVLIQNIFSQEFLTDGSKLPDTSSVALILKTDSDNNLYLDAKEESKTKRIFQFSRTEKGPSSSTRWIAIKNKDGTYSFCNAFYKIGDRWLNGHTSGGLVELIPTNDVSGTKWSFVSKEGFSYLQCMGNLKAGYYWLQYNFREKLLFLATSPDPQKSYARWQVQVFND